MESEMVTGMGLKLAEIIPQTIIILKIVLPLEIDPEDLIKITIRVI